MNDAQRKINAIINDLPDDAQAPSLNKFSLSDLPIMTIGANGKMDEVALRLSRRNLRQYFLVCR
jgi:HAE1 family hydrophobic/amphiphilic exporter-1